MLSRGTKEYRGTVRHFQGKNMKIQKSLIRNVGTAFDIHPTKIEIHFLLDFAIKDVLKRAC